jgi:RND superfamily putative drug exporter
MAMTITRSTRWVLAHRRLVAGAWIVVTLVGIATVSNAVNSFSKTFSVPGRQGFIANARILKTFNSGGRDAPLLAVVTLPHGTTVASPSVKSQIGAVATTLH